jgi:mono/diheme cytochrome c family protein/small nuclear ribonucleoprotein (snRNP)-like protein
MKIFTLVVLLTLVVALGSGLAQHAFTPEEIADGGRLYQTNCVGCHGSSGNLVSGVELMSDRFKRASTDDEVARIIRTGIPGTAMQGFSLTESQASTIVAYLRSMAVSPDSATAGGEAVALGDPTRGKVIFEGKGECLKCHRVNGAGSRFGPDLSTIGAPSPAFGFGGFGPPGPPPGPLPPGGPGGAAPPIRAPVGTVNLQQLQRSILDPNAEVSPANRTVRVVMKDGMTITGRLLNLDLFTVLLLDMSERLLTLQRSNVRELAVVNSPMPSYRDKLSSQELADLLGYLVSLKGQVKQ